MAENSGVEYDTIARYQIRLAREKRRIAAFNKDVGFFIPSLRHPDTCECQGNDPIAHHHDENTHRCQRCDCLIYLPLHAREGLEWVVFMCGYPYTVPENARIPVPIRNPVTNMIELKSPVLVDRQGHMRLMEHFSHVGD